MMNKIVSEWDWKTIYEFINEEIDFMEYLSYMKNISLYPTGPDGNKRSHLLTLSTCDGYEGTRHRLILQGIEVKKRKIQTPA